MTIGELYSAAGPVLATALLVFAPIGMLACCHAFICWLDPEER